MCIYKLKALLPMALFILIGFLPFATYSDAAGDANPKMQMDNSCVTNGEENLKLKFPNLSEDDIKYISIYGCFCAYKEAQKTSLSFTAKDFRNVSDCIYYAVLRNSMRDSSARNDTSGSTIQTSCINNYPHDLTDDSVNEDLSNFCKCASVPTGAIGDERETLNEDQIYEKIMTVIKGCRYNY